MSLTKLPSEASLDGAAVAEAPAPPPPDATPPSQRRRAGVRRFLWRYRYALAGLLVAAAVAVALPGLRSADPAGVPALVLTADLPAGSELSASDVDARSLPAGTLPEAALTDAAQVEGHSLALGLPAGTAVLPSMLVGPGLAESAPPGHVVVAVPLSGSASARLAEAGREVDLLAGPEHGSGPAMVVARSAVVLAHAEDEATPGGGLLAPGSGDSGMRHVYVAVTPDAATVLLGASTWSPLHAVLPGR